MGFSFKVIDDETFTHCSSVFIVEFEHCIILQGKCLPTDSICVKR